MDVARLLHWVSPAISLEKYMQIAGLKPQSWLLTRTACLGKDVLKQLNNHLPILNFQKCRVDYFLARAVNRNLRARTYDIASFMERKDIIPLIAEQEWFPKKFPNSPQCLFMDSFAELTDQLFVHRRKRWQFCCHYSDITRSTKFDKCFETKGLLSVEKMTDYYRAFFEFVKLEFGQVSVIFLHFPTKLDTRIVFRQRYLQILQSINIVSKEFSFIHSIDIDEAIVDWPEEKVSGLENFPYHFNSETYKAFADKIRQLGLFK